MRKPTPVIFCEHAPPAAWREHTTRRAGELPNKILHTLQADYKAHQISGHQHQDIGDPA
jgi:hypothetical protein